MADLVYDVGMHLGEDSDFYLKRGFAVVGVEANPELLPRLRDRFAREIASGRLRIVEKAINFERGRARFAINRELAIWGTLSADFVDRNASQGRQSDFVEVDCVTFDEVLREHGMPHYLKIDIEGREMACLEALRGFASRPRYLSVESRATSPGYGFRDALAELRFLRSLGYTRFKYVDQALIPGTVTSFSVEGVPVVHEFSEDSSGPFGEEAPGRWRSLALGAVSGIGLRLAEDLCGHSGRLYHRFGRSLAVRTLRRARLRLTGRRDHWYDLHAAMP